MSNQTPVKGLILTGGGARAAYQVGVLQEIMAIRQSCSRDTHNPFQVICGTSAGALNASVLACGADQFEKTLNTLADVWHHFQANQVFHSDILNMMRSGARWISLLSLGWLIGQRKFRPKSLLDNAPLEKLLRAHTDFKHLRTIMAQGHLQALAITAFNYSNGEHVTFYQSDADIQSWVRNQRQAMQCHLQLEHLMASSGIPFVFPAARLNGPHGTAWFGDGSMRQTAPVSPAIHLGANQILVIGAGRMHEPTQDTTSEHIAYPSMASIAGHALSSIFLDSLAVDVERLQRINRTLELIPPEKRTESNLKPVELLLISPSERLDEIALRHANQLPFTVKKLLQVMGSSSKNGAAQNGALMSYLFFESVYTQELMALGRSDARAKTAEIQQFFGWG
jgi:NTE family protein